jgi:hypothetical protein
MRKNIDWSGWLMTESGHRAEFDRRLENCESPYCMVVCVTDDEGHQSCEVYTEGGLYDLATAVCSGYNLRNVSAEEWCRRRVA